MLQQGLLDFEWDAVIRRNLGQGCTRGTFVCVDAGNLLDDELA